MARVRWFTGTHLPLVSASPRIAGGPLSNLPEHIQRDCKYTDRKMKEDGTYGAGSGSPIVYDEL